MPELSIIVPVYKVEPYLPKCIDSILAQTFTDFELILIDDGSPDRCGQICDEYAAKDDRIIVIHQENKGVSAARNAGLDIAKGTYIGFVDSDDWIEPEMYHTLVTVAEDEGSKLVACAYCLDDSLPEDNLTVSSVTCRFEGGKDLLMDLFSKPSEFMGTCCTKLFSKDMIGSYRFKENMIVWEDLVFLQTCYINVMNLSISAVKVQNCLYHYRTNVQSATNSVVKVKYGKKQFRNAIFNVLRCIDMDCAKKSLSYFLDSSIQLILKYRQASSEPWSRKAVIEIKWHILYWVVRAFFQTLLTKTERHRFLVEGVLQH